MSKRRTKALVKNNGARQVRSLRLARPKARSRITNGSQLLPNVDHRTVWVRRFKDTLALRLGDLGGDDAVSANERSIARRASLLEVELERREMLFAQAGEVSNADLETYGRTANTLRRLLQAIGMSRRMKDVTPSLSSIVNAERAAQRSRGAE
jgi:hypothetical protein